jgi:PRTRC genetic system protein E
MQQEFFKSLFSIMEDGESLRLTIQKTGDELTIFAVPVIKGKKANINLVGTAEELDEGFITELTKPMERIKGLRSNAEDAKVEDDDDDDSGTDKKIETAKKEADKSRSKKAAAKKKAPAKKVEVKKPEVKKAEPVKPKVSDLPIKEEPKGNDVIQDVNFEKEETPVVDPVVVKDKPKVEEPKAVDSSKHIKDLCDIHLVDGDVFMNAKKYREAEKEYKKAYDLIPSNQDAQRKYENSKKWVDRMMDAGVYTTREV